MFKYELTQLDNLLCESSHLNISEYIKRHICHTNFTLRTFSYHFSAPVTKQMGLFDLFRGSVPENVCFFFITVSIFYVIRLTNFSFLVH